MSHDARFSIIPGWIVTDPRLKGRDLQVLCLLGRHTDKHGWCRRSQVKMADQLSCARSTVQASLDRLGEIGVVEKHIEPSRDGRDSAHSYRVIYDRAPPAGYDFDRYGDTDEKENDPMIGVPNGHPPAGMSAPPAGLGSAPPADSGPAPINDPYLTTPEKRKERERGRDCDEGEENSRALERRLRKWWAGWPSYEVDDENKTRRAWLGLTPEQRKACEEKTPEYLTVAGKSGRTLSKAASTYLTERTWERLADRHSSAASASGPGRFNAYSRPWSALRLVELSKPPIQLTLDKFEEKIVSDSPEKAEMIWRGKREKAGWPEAVRLNEAARERRPVVVPPHIVVISADFDKVEVGGTIWNAWKRLHDNRCWPWLPEPNGLPFVQFPALPEGMDDPDQAVAEALRRFQKRLVEEGNEDDAA